MIFASVTTAAAESIGADEKRPLEAAKKEAARLVHPTLGFSIAKPGDGFVFKAAPSVATHVPPGIDAYGYAWVGDGGKRALLIVHVADTAPDKAAYAEMVAGLRSNMFRALVDDRDLHVDHEQIAWSKTAAESHPPRAVDRCASGSTRTPAASRGSSARSR